MLVRTNKQASVLAKAFYEHRQGLNAEEAAMFNTVSNETFRLGNALLNQLIFTVACLVQQPRESILWTKLIWYYQQLIEQQPSVLTTIKERKQAENYLPKTFFNTFDRLSGMNLIEGVAEIRDALDFGNMKLAQLELPFFMALLDEIMDLNAHGSHTWSDFAQWWEEEGKNKAVLTAQAKDAISIMTVHKAKGLEFPIVIAPFLEWAFESKGGKNVLWLSQNEIPEVNAVQVFPVNYSKKSMEGTVYENAFYQERFMNHLDVLNLFYVALTRPVDAFYGFFSPPKDRESSNIRKSLEPILESFVESKTFSLSYGPQHRTYSFGDKTWKNIQAHELKPIQAISIHLSPEKAKNSTYNVALSDSIIPDLDEQMPDQALIGTHFHLLMARINQFSDTQTAHQTISSIRLKENEKEQLHRWINQLIHDKKFMELFDHAISISSEQEVFYQGQLIRPDKVFRYADRMIILDFKTGKALEHHKEQIKQYADAFSAILKLSVEAHLIYLEPYQWISIN
jgi:ATP-dependent exoDNAse (exonuclease V) beta subunit